MQYLNLGRSGLRVSRLCLGAMMFGGRTQENDALAIIERAREQGVNFIDTADAYNGGRSERIVGRGIHADRGWWVVATKVFNVMGEGPNRRGLSRKWLHAACDGSLKRLGTDHIDVYYLHKEDLGTPLEETVRAMGDLIRGGKVRYFGVSNFRAWRIAEICRLCDQMGMDRPVVSQPLYNLLNRQAETEQLPVCGHYGLGVFPYSPLARGVLSGKYRPGAEPDPDSRAGARDRRMMETEWRPESLAIAAEVKVHAQARGTTTSRFALAWVLRNRLVTGAVAGPRTMAQWEDYVAALEVALDGEDEALVDRLVTSGHPSTPGYNDPTYPIEGRPLVESG